VRNVEGTASLPVVQDELDMLMQAMAREMTRGVYDLEQERAERVVARATGIAARCRHDLADEERASPAISGNLCARDCTWGYVDFENTVATDEVAALGGVKYDLCGLHQK
jgi:hypothetical protein